MLTPVSHTVSPGHTPSSQENDRQTLEAFYTKIKHHIDNNLPASNEFGSLDMKMLPQLTAWANRQYPGLSLHYAATPDELGQKMAEIVRRGETSGRFITNYGIEGMHMCALDYKFINGQHSLLSLESGSSQNPGPARMPERIKSALDAHIPDSNIHFTTLEVNQQSSSFDCAMFSLDSAVKMHKATEDFEKLHEKHIEGNLAGKNDQNIVTSAWVDKLLPAIFMKHMQSFRRLDQVLEAQPDLKDKVINKSDETLAQRMARHRADRVKGNRVRPRNESIAWQREKFVRKTLE